MNILAGGPTREVESDVFKLHKEALERQNGFNVQVEHLIVRETPAEHRWNGDRVENVAKARQQYLNRCRPKNLEQLGDGLPMNLGVDGLFLVDSDVICGPDVLQRLWDVDADVVYGVFWTVWPGFEVPLPQVWDIHPYGYTKEVMETLTGGGTCEVYGGGACTLIRNRGFESRYHPLLEGLKHAQGGFWAGEDRTFCLGLEFLGVKQVAVAGLDIVHLYDESMQTPEAIAEARSVCGL